MTVERIQVGGIEVFALLDALGDVDIPIEESFPGWPEGELLRYSARYPTLYGEAGSWRLAVRCWLIRHPAGQILVDTGIGGSSAPGPEWFGSEGLLQPCLSEVGTSAADIDTVVVSHVHDDHVGGTVAADGSLSFPNARHLIQKADVDWQRQAAAGDDEDRVIWEVLIAPLESAGVLVAIDEDMTLAEGVSVERAPGHTPGHQVVWVSAGESRALITADSFNHPAQLAHPDWPSGPDNDQQEAARTRRRLLAELAMAPSAVFAPTHFGEAFGHLVTGSDHVPSWEPLQPQPSQGI